MSDRMLGVDEVRRGRGSERAVEPDLCEARDLLLSSIQDLERERDAGDISEEDYRVLRDRYTTLAATVLRDIQEASNEDGIPGGSPAEDAPAEDAPAEDADEPRRSRTRGRRVWMVALTGALLVVIVASIVLVVRGASERLPGETATGSVSLNAQQQLTQSLAQAEILESRGDAAEALRLYQQILSKHPNQEQALAESGWLEFEAGVAARRPSLLSDGQTDELRAENLEPSDYAPHLYLGSMLLVEDQSVDAVSQYQLFLDEDPPSSVVKSAAPFIERAYRDAGRTPPPLPGGS